jgi:hypothetical protein
MKRSEIAAIIAIAVTSMAVAYFVANAFIGKPSSTTVKVRTITQISSEVEQPDSKVFNKDAINPTVEVVIGND